MQVTVVLHRLESVFRTYNGRKDTRTWILCDNSVLHSIPTFWMFLSRAKYGGFTEEFRSKWRLWWVHLPLMTSPQSIFSACFDCSYHYPSGLTACTSPEERAGSGRVDCKGHCFVRRDNNGCEYKRIAYQISRRRCVSRLRVTSHVSDAGPAPVHLPRSAALTLVVLRRSLVQLGRHRTALHAESTAARISQ